MSLEFAERGCMEACPFIEQFSNIQVSPEIGTDVSK
jgi:hypothetical protein